MEVFIPFAAFVEVAGVLTRLASSSLAREVVVSLRTSENYHIVYEEEIRDHAIKIALEVGSSGFDTYFIAVAKMFNAMLIADDEPMVGSALDLAFKDRVFDVVYMIAVFGELLNKEKALLEVRRVLKNNGILAIGWILFDSDYPRIRTVIVWYGKIGPKLVDKHDHVLHHLFVFRK